MSQNQRQQSFSSGAETSANLATSSARAGSPTTTSSHHSTIRQQEQQQQQPDLHHPDHPPERQRPDDRPEYPLGVPSKFSPSGKVQPFRGNTIICHLSPSSNLYQKLLKLHSVLQALKSRFHLAVLPPPSWHMTLFEGVCDSYRVPGHWPSGLSPEKSIEECTSFLASKLQEFELGNDEKPPYKLRVEGFSPLEVGIGVHIEFANTEEEKRVRGLRDRLSESLGIRHRQHDFYEMHITMAYLLRHLGGDEEKELRGLLYGFLKEEGMNDPEGYEFELGRPEFCTFESMERFERLSYLGG